MVEGGGGEIKREAESNPIRHLLLPGEKKRCGSKHR